MILWLISLFKITVLIFSFFIKTFEKFVIVLIEKSRFELILIGYDIMLIEKVTVIIVNDGSDLQTMDYKGFIENEMWIVIDDAKFRPVKPFKMLAVLTIFIFFVAWAFNLKDPLVGKNIADVLNGIEGIGETMKYTFNHVGRLLIFLDTYDLYRILIQNIIVVPVAWLVFRKKGYNMVETFFSQIYINCQFHLCCGC